MANETSLTNRLLGTPNDTVLTAVRIVLGIVMFAHGAQKMLGWFGGPGFNGTMEMFKTGMGIPAPLAILAILAEFLGGIGLVLGLLARVAALGIAINMLVAAFLVHLPHGLFANWAGTKQGEGFEYHLLALALCLVLIAKGAGAFSMDRVLRRGFHSSAETPPLSVHPHHAR